MAEEEEKSENIQRLGAFSTLILNISELWGQETAYKLRITASSMPFLMSHPNYSSFVFCTFKSCRADTRNLAKAVSLGECRLEYSAVPCPIFTQPLHSSDPQSRIYQTGKQLCLPQLNKTGCLATSYLSFPLTRTTANLPTSCYFRSAAIETEICPR